MSNMTFLKLSIFIILLLFAPSFYFVGVAAGIVPAILYLYLALSDLSLITFILWGIHLAIYVALYFLISHIITAIIFKVKNVKAKLVIVSLVITGIIAASFSPIFIAGGHNTSKTMNIIDVYKEIGGF